jgi:hypothetical protein
MGQAFFANRSVGGVAINAEGVLEAPTVEDAQTLAALREQTQLNVPAALAKFKDLRAVSLKQLEAMVARCRAENRELPEEISYLAGLQRIRYIVYPEQHDVVLLACRDGRSMAWAAWWGKRPTAQCCCSTTCWCGERRLSRVDPITCSIDPTAAGLQRLQELVSQLAISAIPTRRWQ